MRSWLLVYPTIPLLSENGLAQHTCPCLLPVLPKQAIQLQQPGYSGSLQENSSSYR